MTKNLLFFLVAIFATGCISTGRTPMHSPPSRQARYEACLQEEKAKAETARQIAPIYEQKAKDVASPNIERCSVFLSRGPGSGPSGSYGLNGRPGFGPQPGRGYYSTEDCSNWRQYGLEEACRRQQARDGSNQRQGAFDLGRSGANCGGFGVADLRESCEFGRRVTREREAERIFNLTR